MLGTWVAYHTRTAGPIDDYDAQTAELARSGMNYVPHPYWSQYNSTMGGEKLFDQDSLTAWQQVDGIYGKYNMKYAVTIDKNTAARVEIGKQLTNANSYYVADEPSDSALSTHTDIIKQAAAADGTRFPFINLFPSYAGSSALGGSLEYHMNHLIELAGVENLEYLGLDHYNFAAGGEEGSYSSSYFSDMEIQRRTAYNNGKMKTGGFTQTGVWNARRYPTINEVTWNTNTMLAYGYKMINHFCWVPPYNTEDGQLGEKFGSHVLDQYGNKTVLYEPMQKLNWQTRQIGQVMMDMDCVHAYHVGSSIPSGTESLPSDFMIQPDTATKTKSLILSEFISKDETETYVAVTNNSINTVNTSFLLNEGITGLVRYDVDSFDTLPSDASIAAGTAVGAPTQVSIDTSSHSLSVTLAPGEIKLFKVEGSVTSTAIQDPVPSLDGGAYSSPQTLTFTTADNSTQVYYTLDGSYPTRATNLYTGTGIKVGTTGQTGRVTVRYKAYKGHQETDAKAIDFFFTPNSSDIFNLGNQGIGWEWNDSTPSDTSDDWVNWSWSVENGVVKKHTPKGDWDTGLTWGQNTYTDFVLEGDFFINENNGEGSGFIGFAVNKASPKDVQSQKKGDLCVGLFANGADNMRTFFWRNQSEAEGPATVNTGVNYAASPTVNLRLVKLGNTVEFTVNGTQTYTATSANFNKTGYVGLVSSSFTIHVSNLTITPIADKTQYASSVPAVEYFIDDTTIVQPESTYVATNVTNPTGFVVDKGTAFSNIGLPATTTVKDSEGNSYTLDVQWDSSTYNANTEGAQVVTGTLITPVQLANANNTKLTADVLVRYTFDREPYRQIIADAKAYKADDYTVASYNYLQEQIAMAEELVNDEWQWQSSVGVGTDVKVAGAIKSLVNVSELRTLVTQCSSLNLSSYTQGTTEFSSALTAATTILNKDDASATEVATATSNLLEARYSLKTAVTASFAIAGMSIRTGAPEGLRFVATMSSEMKTQYADAKFGMMILPADMDTSGFWTVSIDGTNYTTNNGAIVIEKGEWWSSELMSENSLSGAAYSCALVGDTTQFPAEFYNRAITAVAFVIKGSETIYSEKVTRSIGYVAMIDSLKNSYVESDVVERVVAGTEITLSVGSNNKIAYNASATPVVKIGGMDATTSSLVSVSYKSSNTSIASIVSGQVKAVGTGTATITATVSVTNGKSFTKTVEVNCGSLDSYTTYFEQGFEGQTSFSHSDALNTGGSTTKIITSGAISEDSSLQFITASTAEAAGWNIMMLSHLGGTTAGSRYLVQMKVKVTAPASVTDGELRFRLRDGDSATEVEGLVIDVTNHTVKSQSDAETMCVYDSATGVYTVAVFMTADATNKKFNLTTVGGGSWTVTVDDVSYSYA